MQMQLKTRITILGGLINERKRDKDQFSENKHSFRRQGVNPLTCSAYKQTPKSTAQTKDKKEIIEQTYELRYDFEGPKRPEEKPWKAKRFDRSTDSFTSQSTAQTK